MTSAYKILLDIVNGLAPLGPTEATEEYLKRLADAVASLPLRIFETLPPPAQQWYDAAADALMAGLNVPAPDGFDRDIAIRLVAPGPTGPANPKLVLRPTGSAAPSPHLPPSVDPAPPIATDESLSAQVSRMIIADEAVSIDTVMQRLRERRIAARRGSVSTVRNQALTFLRLLREAGWQPPLTGSRHPKHA